MPAKKVKKKKGKKKLCLIGQIAIDVDLHYLALKGFSNWGFKINSTLSVPFYQ